MSKIPFLNLSEANLPIEPEILDAVNRVVKSGWFILGNELKNFERQLADDLRGKNFGFVAGCNSGTDALILSLKAAGVNRGDEVITVSHTAIPTVAAIVSAGAIPVFVDIDLATWVMDVRNVKAAVTPKTKAIVPVHLYGNMVDVHAIKKSSANSIARTSKSLKTARRLKAPRSKIGRQALSATSARSASTPAKISALSATPAQSSLPTNPPTKNPLAPQLRAKGSLSCRL